MSSIAVKFVWVITRFRVQFAINQHEYIFQRLTKLHEPVGRVQFVVFEKFTSADLSQIAREKSCDYLLIIHIQKFYTASTSGCQTFKHVFSRLPFRFLVKTLCSCRPGFVNLDTASEILLHAL